MKNSHASGSRRASAMIGYATNDFTQITDQDGATLMINSGIDTLISVGRCWPTKAYPAARSDLKEVQAPGASAHTCAVKKRSTRSSQPSACRMGNDANKTVNTTVA